jgi:hypothetical protein
LLLPYQIENQIFYDKKFKCLEDLFYYTIFGTTIQAKKTSAP